MSRPSGNKHAPSSQRDGIPFDARRETPKATTRAALAEYDEMRRNPSAHKRHATADDMFDEALDATEE